MSEWYDPDGNPLSDVEARTWSNREPGGMWDREHLSTEVEGGHVSTVWLGLDHSYDEGPPLIFETMAFCDGPLDQEQRRYQTREQARAGHAEMVELITSERAAWRDLLTDERVIDCAQVVADALRAHGTISAYRDPSDHLGDLFDDLLRAFARAS